jgi:uncharacterized cupredoxin-like copper-binding protein
MGVLSSLPVKEFHLLRRMPLATGVVAAILLVAACGGSKPATTMPGMDHSNGATTAPSAARVVDVMMSDIKYDVPQISVKRGETVKFVFHNQGKLVHEAVIGDATMQNAHEQQMGGMAMSDSATAIAVDPGKTGELTYTFNTAGQLQIGCHQPGHYAAGMKLDVTVA